MARMKKTTGLSLALGALLYVAGPAGAQERWVPTWTASPISFPVPAQPAAGKQPPAARIDRSFNNQTVRMVVRTSIPGKRVRIQLSNAYGTSALEIGAAHIALRSKDSEIVAGSDRTLTFSGKPKTSIPPGALVVSDPVDLDVPKLGDLAVSVHVPGETGPPTIHTTGLHTTFLTTGDTTGQSAMADAATTVSYYWLASVDVPEPANAGLIVAFGDSITDGATSTPNTNSSWPAVLAERLARSAARLNLAVVNQGIGGNRLLRDVAGTNALARLDRDVFSQTGVKWLILLEGINDIGRATTTAGPRDGTVSSDDLIAAYKQIIARAHMRGIKVMGGTLTPYQGAGYYSEAGEAIREAANAWIRTSGAFDAVVDFEAAVRDPQNPKQFRPGFNITDHLHPNDAGYKAMAEAIDLSYFTGKRAAPKKK